MSRFVVGDAKQPFLCKLKGMKNRSVGMITLAQVRSMEDCIFWMRSKNALLKEW